MVKRSPRKHFYVIMTTAPIDVLGGITGPIKTPVQLTPYQALKCITEGLEVYEVNPYNNKERTKVSRANYNSIVFNTTKEEMIKKRRLNGEIRAMNKKPTPLKASPTMEEKLSKVQEVEGKPTIDLPTPKVEEMAMKKQDFVKT